MTRTLRFPSVNRALILLLFVAALAVPGIAFAITDGDFDVKTKLFEVVF